MEGYTLSKIFFDVYNSISNFNNKKIFKNINDYNLLENALEEYLVSLLGISIKYNYEEHYREIRKYFENIVNNVEYDGVDLISNIKLYQEEFKRKIANHPYTEIFIESLQRLYSRDYDGKVTFFDSINDYSYNSLANGIDKADTMISNINNRFIIGRISRKDENELPSVYIDDIDSFEKVLEKYVHTVSVSDSYYNIFSNEKMKDIPYKNKVRALFETIMFNATSSDLIYVEQFFHKYIDFISDETLMALRKLNYVGNVMDDELFVMLKRSELEYETPYCLCFMLKNNVIELPNIRLGIETQGHKKIAHILATQTTQSSHINRENMKKIEKYLKNIIPNDSSFRFFNPSHLVSLLMCFGILKGMGISDIEVVDYLPFRHKKTVLDKQMSDEEAANFQMRLTDKNMITYMRLVSVINGIKILSYPEMDMGLKLNISNNVTSESEELQSLYDICYEFGKKMKEENLENIRK